MDLSPRTLAVSAGRPAREPDAPLNPPVVLASTYHAGGEVGYGRYGNPTWLALEEVVGALEGGTALAFASGLAAVSAVLGTLPTGSIVVAPTTPYLGTAALLTEHEESRRLVVRRVDIAHTETIEAASVGAAMVWLESPTNPLMGVVDLRAASAAAHQHGAVVAVDSTFSTPFGVRPLDLGADVVIHSATKQIAGHSDVVLGLAVTTDAGLLGQLDATRRLHGAVPGPFEAWLALRGLRTLPLRHERASANAAVIAERALAHPAVTRVRYPGLHNDAGHAIASEQWRDFGSLLSIEVTGGADAADRICGAVRLWVNTTSLGGVESTLERRRRWPTEHPEVPESLIRMSVGIEDVEDLWRDLVAALDTTL